MQSLQITTALILSCSALLFINASAFPFPWAEVPLAETESIYRDASCCSPRIVTSPRAKKSSVIRSVPDYSGEVDIVADGGPSGRGRPCDKEEYGFTVIVNWGDGTIDASKQYVFGLFNMIHQYEKRDRTPYDVTVYYCSTPLFKYYNNYNLLNEGCCGTMSKTIEVTNNPGTIGLL